MDTGKSALGLDGNLAAALGYPIGIIAIICLIMEKENRFVKFHALQSILLHVAFILVAIVVWILGFILLIAGLFGFAGHSHVVRARAFSGRVVYYPGAPANSRVEVSIPTDSLEVMTPPDTSEIRKVTEAMRGEVLHVDQYPLITFFSTSVAPTGEGFHAEGQLTIAGQSRDVGADVTATIGRDTLRAGGSFTVKQTDFGIRPFRGGPANTVRVADRVTLTLEVLGIRTE